MAGIGSRFLRKADTGDTYKAIAGITEMGEIAQTRETTQKTTFASEDGWHEYGSGLRDGGELTLTLLFKSSDEGQKDLQADFDSDVPGEYKIELSDDDQSDFAFKALVTNYGVAIPLGEDITRSVTLKISGKIKPGNWSDS